MRTQHHEGSQIRTRIPRTDPVKILTQCRESLKFCFVTRMVSMFQRRGVIFPCKRISSCAHYVTLQNYFSHPSLVIYFLAITPMKLEPGQQIGGELLIVNHLEQSLSWVIRNTEQQSDHIYYTRFFMCASSLRLLPATANCAIMLNHPEPNRHILTVFHPILMWTITY